MTLLHDNNYNNTISLKKSLIRIHITYIVNARASTEAVYALMLYSLYTIYYYES